MPRKGLTRRKQRRKESKAPQSLATTCKQSAGIRSGESVLSTQACHWPWRRSLPHHRNSLTSTNFRMSCPLSQGSHSLALITTILSSGISHSFQKRSRAKKERKKKNKNKGHQLINTCSNMNLLQLKTKKHSCQSLSSLEGARLRLTKSPSASSTTLTLVAEKWSCQWLRSDSTKQKSNSTPIQVKEIQWMCSTWPKTWTCQSTVSSA